MKIYKEVRNNFIQNGFDIAYGDILISIAIDTWIPNKEEGETVAEVILTEHKDICVIWKRNEARLDEDVIKAIEKVKTGLKRYKDRIRNESFYFCELCNTLLPWESDDEINGTLWSCEECGETFCKKCFIDKFGEAEYYLMTCADSTSEKGEIIRCPECYKKILNKE